MLKAFKTWNINSKQHKIKVKNKLFTARQKVNSGYTLNIVCNARLQ